MLQSEESNGRMTIQKNNIVLISVWCRINDDVSVLLVREREKNWEIS